MQPDRGSLIGAGPLRIEPSASLFSSPVRGLHGFHCGDDPLGFFGDRQEPREELVGPL
jgi:hypothetical protein